MTANNWFERLTGFAEGTYASTQDRLAVEGDELVSSVNGKRYGIGTLTLPTLAELRSRVTLPTGGRTTVQRVDGNVADLHAAPEYEGALFQVASQFNVLEMTGPSVRPEDGVTGYAGDPTQGPACAVAAGAATIYRNYFAPVGDWIGQTRDRQIDTLAGVGEALSALLDRPVGELWTMSNGYALCTSDGLEAIAALLADATEDERDALRARLAIGLHRDVEVTRVDGDVRPYVSQAFCSALPASYGRSAGGRSLWEPLARLVLEATYEATLLAAVERAAAGGSRTVLLTRVGGGAFGNEQEWITDAIWRALSIVEHAGLDIRLVDYHPSPHSQGIAESWSRRSWPHDELMHAWWVEPGALLAGEYPYSVSSPDKTRQKLRVLVDAGVDSFVDLTHPEDRPFMEPYVEILREEAARAGQRGPNYRRFPIPDTKTIAREGYDEILDYIQSELDAGRIVYVHCWGGKGRTSTVIGCRLIDGGLDYDGAMARIRELRAGTKKSHHRVPDTQEQDDVLRDRAERPGRTRTP